MKIRSITVFSQMSIPLDKHQIQRLAAAAHSIAQAYTTAGYEVQTTRLATDFFPTVIQQGHTSEAIELATELESACCTAGFDYVAAGPAGPELCPLVPAILAATETLFATCHIAKPDTNTIDGEAIQSAARIMQEAAAIQDGFGNLRFGALANVQSGTPFFPAAYWTADAPALGIAVESADLALTACLKSKDAHQAHTRLSTLITSHGQRIQEVGQKAAQAHKLKFLGIDFSLAPFPDPETSIGAALECLTNAPLGAPGTLAAAAVLTDAIQQADFKHTGFCGLMLPVLEDSLLARRAAEGRLHISDLLQWSAVCGTGLDTVPLPGETPITALERLLFDVAALALRTHKPLTARLMLLPGKKAGDPVNFDFDYFAPGGVLSLESDSLKSTREDPLSQANALKLSPTLRP